MPGFDGTGPRGAGPMSGGGQGFCNPAAARYAPRFGRRIGYGRGFGRVRAFGRAFASYPSDPSQEMEMLKTQVDSMTKAIDEINKRIEQLKKDSSE